MEDKARQLESLIKLLQEEFGIESEDELNAAVRALPKINLAPFCAPVNLGTSAGQSARCSNGQSHG